MALKDSFIGLNKALRTTLQNVPAVVDTLIRGFDEIGDAAEAENTYSTDERVVGKWIDGSDIYEKTINTGAYPINTVKNIPHGITNLGQVLEIKGVALGTNIAASLPITNPSGDGILVYYAYADATNIVIRTNYTYSVYSDGYITIRYTKSTSNRAPENDTRNGDAVKTTYEPVEDPAADPASNEPVEDLKK